MKINYTKSLNDIAALADIWCAQSDDGQSIASWCDIAVRANSKYIAVMPSAVNMAWTWLEKKDVQVLCIMDTEQIKSQIQNNKS
ncbi:MAG: hypothetical protein FWC83_02755, partial [Alphaproteobacteria bacterium]|nr:hypothetical protein [Alphaproteobacteria bacterium]